jgi:hypothetical protein
MFKQETKTAVRFPELFIKKGEIQLTSNYQGISLLLIVHTILTNILPSRLTPHAVIGTSDVTDQLLIRYSAFTSYCRNNWSTMGQFIKCLDLNKA